MAVAGGLLALIGLALAVVALWALARGGLRWANIADRRTAGRVLGAASVVFVAGALISPREPSPDDVTFRAHVDETTDNTAEPSTSTAAVPGAARVDAAGSSAAAPIQVPPTTATSSAPTSATTTRPAPPTTRPPVTAPPPVATPPPPAPTAPTPTRSQPVATTTTSLPPTVPPAPQPVTSAVAFGTLQCDAPGTPDDATNTNDEWVEIVSPGGAVDLTGWIVHDEGANYSFVLPSFTLGPGARVMIHTGVGQNTATDLYWSRSQHVWNNTGTEIAYLANPAGALVATKSCR